MKKKNMIIGVTCLSICLIYELFTTLSKIHTISIAGIIGSSIMMIIYISVIIWVISTYRKNPK